LYKLHSLRVLAEFVGDFGQVGKRFGVVGMQHTACVHSALLRHAEIFESMGKSVGAEEHLAVVDEHSHVFGLQRRRLANGNTVRDVRWGEWSSAAAVEVEVSSEKLESNL
jgi:hypothetical protein